MGYYDENGEYLEEEEPTTEAQEAEEALAEEELIAESPEEQVDLPIETEYLAEPSYDHESEKQRLLQEHSFLVDKTKRLEEENQKLWDSAKESYEALAKNYEHDLERKVDESKLKQKLAIEESDVDGQVKAQVELAEAIANLTTYRNQFPNAELEYSYAAEEPEEEPIEDRQDDFVQEVQRVKQANIDTWTSQNEWFNSDSKQYDQELHDIVQNYSLALENQLYRAGKADLLYSPQYFQTIDNVRNQAIENRRKQNLKMQGISNGVSSGKPSYTAKNAAKNTNSDLSDEELRIAKICKLSPEKYAQYRNG